MNPYEYVNGGPTVAVDPLGLARQITGNDSVDDILKALAGAITQSRGRGWLVAAANLEHWLGNSGTDQWISADWLLQDNLIQRHGRDAMRVEYWERRTLPKYADELEKGKAVVDYWDRLISYRKQGQFRIPEAELAYAAGDSTLQGQGVFVCSGKDAVEGYVRFLWWDSYDFHEGLHVKFPGGDRITDTALLKVAKAGHGKGFYMYSMWIEKAEFKKEGRRWVGTFSRVADPALTTVPASTPAASHILKGPPQLPVVRLRGKVVNWGGIRVLHKGDEPYWRLEE